jgi:hypothetical protein
MCSTGSTPSRLETTENRIPAQDRAPESRFNLKTITDFDLGEYCNSM